MAFPNLQPSDFNPLIFQYAYLHEVELYADGHLKVHVMIQLFKSVVLLSRQFFAELVALHPQKWWWHPLRIPQLSSIRSQIFDWIN